MKTKIIHYCWFGGKPLPKTAKKCIESWKKFFPDYEIKEWNERNFNIEFNDYTKEAYNCKKYAFLTDVARLYIIYQYGGIYFDTDVEVIKPFEEILDSEAFFGLESNGYVATGLGFGANKGNWLVKELLDDYNDRHLIKPNGELDIIPCPKINSVVFKKNGFQLNNEIEKINNVVVYPIDYFNPMDVGTGKVKITKRTKTIHWYNKSWVPKHLVIRSIITKPFHRIFGNNCFDFLKKRKK